MARSDSIRYIDDDSVQRIHSNKSSGKLYKAKGHHSSVQTASIPSKYQTVVIDNSEKKGFLSKETRFGALNINENPGPGSYIAYCPASKENTSFSKKGVGGLAAKVKRHMSDFGTGSPGAGTYGLPGLLSTRKDFNKSSQTAAFHAPIAVKRPADVLPAPNHYNVLKSDQSKKDAATENAAFRSRTRRDVIAFEDRINKPSPCQYEIRDDIVKDSVKVPFSSFKSSTRRRMRPDPHDYPGPGTYKPYEPISPVEKTTFPRQHYLCISAPAMALEKPPPTPGPGAYDTVDYEGAPKHFMSGSSFVSVTTRCTGAPIALVPGPAHYRPAEIGKQSFFLNINRKWL